MRKAGVLGWPVAHSLSPKLHGYWLKKYRIDGEYTAVETQPDDLSNTLKSLVGMGWRGCNLTIPHKEKVLPLLDSINDIARSIGAVNTVVIENGKLTGSNTDIYGFTENIRPYLLRRNKAIVYGRGGAARAVWSALWSLGFSDIISFSHSEKQVTFSRKEKNRFIAQSWENRSNSEIFEKTDLLVNTTNQGMIGQPPLDIDLSALPKSALVTDIVYTPLITPLLQKAKARGNPIVDGLGMLLHQAVPGFAAWFGITPEVTDELRNYVLGESA